MRLLPWSRASSGPDRLSPIPTVSNCLCGARSWPPPPLPTITRRPADALSRHLQTHTYIRSTLSHLHTSIHTHALRIICLFIWRPCNARLSKRSCARHSTCACVCVCVCFHFTFTYTYRSTLTHSYTHTRHTRGHPPSLFVLVVGEEVFSLLMK